MKRREWTLRLDTLVINNLNEAQLETMKQVERPVVKVVSADYCESLENLLRDLIVEWEAGRVYAPTDKRNIYDRTKDLLFERESGEL